MAFSFFKQRDIDAMDENDIPEEFINYFDSLSDDRKREIIQSRPDLARGLGYSLPKEIKKNLDKGAPDSNIAVNDSVRADQKDIFVDIKKNIYLQAEMDKVIRDGLVPVDALIVEDGVRYCPIHRTPLKSKDIKYRPSGHFTSTYGVSVKYCNKCHRIFLEESKTEAVHQAFQARGIAHTFYDKQLSDLYMHSLMPVYELAEAEKVYYPDSWIEENPLCPIHDKRLLVMKCQKSYKGRKVSFSGYYCSDCRKIIIRRAAVSKLIDQCGVNGVPEIEAEHLVNRAPRRKPISRREIKPDYYIQDGKRVIYAYDHIADCYRLSENDTVVISDSRYCNLEDHTTKEVLVLITVHQKHGGRKAYLVIAGYCADCQKFYVELDDYKAMYAYGRPEVTVLSDIDDDTIQITSGEVYNLENDHLKNVVNGIIDEVDSIKKQPDYVGRYATGFYDDGNLNFAKNWSIEKYGPRLDKLGAIQPKPYIYRVDIYSGEDTETYYIGASDLELEGKQQVISFNNPFGRELVNYQTIKLQHKGKEFKVKLSRQFDIENSSLYGYVNLRTDEDIIFRKGITDPFLVRVLNIRKRQHNLIDIIATIQENQNRIVDTEFSTNIVVQGCAGSGKTMVLLHRISSLQYRMQHFDFSREALILTPNERFNLHIQGLAEGLQISNVQRLSVEEYYIDRLTSYSESLKPSTRLVSEMLVQQNFVDYVYSDQFRKDFDKAYDVVLNKRNRLGELLDNLTEAMHRPHRKLDFSDPGVMQQLRFAVRSLNATVEAKDQAIKIAGEAVERDKNRISLLERKIAIGQATHDSFVQEIMPAVNAKIGKHIEERYQKNTELERQLEDANSEKERIQNTLIVFNRRTKVRNVEAIIEEVSVKLEAAQKKQIEEDAVFSRSLEGMTDEEVISWMQQLVPYINSIQEELDQYTGNQKELNKNQEDLQGLRAQLEQDEQKYRKIEIEKYGDDVRKTIRYLSEKAEEYSETNTFRMIFDEAVADFRKYNNIRRIVGNWHRYDLYAALLFAMKFYGSANGNIRFMCIDEGQDLAMNEYRLLYELNHHNVVFNIYGDTNQLVKPGRGVSDWTELERIFKATEFKLNENYRNTNQITRFCNSSFDMDVLRTGVDGPAVQEIARNELEGALSSLNINNERIAIIVPREVPKNRYLNRDELPGHINKIIGEEIGNNRIALMYVDEVKGIEFDRVYVISNKMSRNEKYIAYTRALSNLIIVVDENVQERNPYEGDDALVSGVS